MSFDPPCKAVLFFRSPSSFELSSIPALAVQFKVMVVLEPGEFRRADGFFGKDSGDETSFRHGWTSLLDHRAVPQTYLSPAAIERAGCKRRLGCLFLINLNPPPWLLTYP